MKNVVIRVPPVWGVGDHLYKSGLWTFIEKARKGEDIEIWGDYETPRLILYIKDLVDCIIYLLDECLDFRGELQIASDYCSLEREVKAVSDIFSFKRHPPEIHYRPEATNGIRFYSLVDAKNEGTCNWKPSWSLYDMLRDMKEILDGRILD
jgi:UDP-glucose 4-epimerase